MSARTSGGRLKKSRCERCGAIFESLRNLERHFSRKRPCDPIIDKEDLPVEQRESSNRCRYCGRVYSRSDGLTRHLKLCKIANSDEGMEKLLDHTLQRQLADQNAKIAELTALVAQITSGQPPQIAQVNNGPVTNTTPIVLK